jgi:hypothetical protein
MVAVQEGEGIKGETKVNKLMYPQDTSHQRAVVPLLTALWWIRHRVRPIIQ